MVRGKHPGLGQISALPVAPLGPPCAGILTGREWDTGHGSGLCAGGRRIGIETEGKGPRGSPDVGGGRGGIQEILVVGRIPTGRKKHRLRLSKGERGKEVREGMREEEEIEK